MAYPDTVDMSLDHEVWNDTETITYYEKTTEAVPANGVSVDGTLWLSIRKDRLQADSLLAQMDMTVDQPKVKLGTIVPKTDDVMKRADNTRWIIKVVEVVATAQEFRCHVKRIMK